MRIYVKRPHLRAIPLDVEASDTIDNVKTALAAMDCFCWASSFFRNGAKLEDGQTLSEQGVASLDVLQCPGTPPVIGCMLPPGSP